MKRIAAVLSLMIAILLLSAVLLGSDECMLSVEKTVRAGYSVIEFDTINYRIYLETKCQLFFTKIDDRYHRLSVRPIKVGPMIFQEMSIQWGSFPTVPLGLDSADGNDYELDTETGYAEKVS